MFAKNLSIAIVAFIATGCAHQIDIKPNLSDLGKRTTQVKIDKKIGYILAGNVEKEVVTPGGGGDSVRYKPYKELAEGIKFVLSNSFTKATQFTRDIDISEEDIDLSAILQIRTNSSSSSAATWPPTQFNVDLTFEIKDRDGNLVNTVVANGEGYSEFNEWILSDKGISAKRASVDALNKFQKTLSTPKVMALISNSSAPLQEAQTNKGYKSAAKSNLELSLATSDPDEYGVVTLKISSSQDLLSLTINGEELGRTAKGIHEIKRSVRVGQDTNFIVAGLDIHGNSQEKIATVKRYIKASVSLINGLNPQSIPKPVSTDAVAIIIGIQNYKKIPKAEFASDDAKDFYDYAIRALGIKPENIKLLIDDQADDVEILAAFRNWLPVKVRKQKTDLYVFYSGHGLPSDDGKNLYFLPHGTDRQFLERTALTQQNIISEIKASQPRSVTMFIDACYSGQTRTGETLVASARPIAILQSAATYPPEYSVFSASAPDQFSSSNPDLKHGIFSYYLMKGMEGEADENKDGKITYGEMQSYLKDTVGRQAMTLNRRQNPQLIGESDRILVRGK